MALLVSAMVFFGLGRLGSHVRTTAVFQNMVVEGYVEQVLNQFQEYVTSGGVKSTDYLDIQVWLSDNTGIGFLFDREADSGNAQARQIHFADRSIWVLPYISSTQSSGIINLIAVAGAFICFLIIMTRVIREVISDIKHLSQDMAILTDGKLDHEVHLSGKGELADLAQSIDAMRLSVIGQISRENEAITANHELITALSHDLRTPLTKQMGYLELALDGKCGELTEAMESCLRKIYKATCDLHDRSEELFSYAIVFNRDEDTARVTEVIDGQFLLGQLLEDQAAYLRSKGFDVNSLAIQTPFKLRVVVPALSRIFDNITANIVKYASKDYVVNTYCVRNDGKAFIHFENYVHGQNEAMEGTQIGFRSSNKLAQSMGGSLHTQRTINRYLAILELPCME